MKLPNLLIFLIVFLSITLGVPFVLATFLPTVFAILGSMGITLVTGVVLYFLLGRVKEATPSA